MGVRTGRKVKVEARRGTVLNVARRKGLAGVCDVTGVGEGGKLKVEARGGAVVKESRGAGFPGVCDVAGDEIAGLGGAGVWVAGVGVAEVGARGKAVAEARGGAVVDGARGTRIPGVAADCESTVDEVELAAGVEACGVEGVGARGRLVVEVRGGNLVEEARRTGPDGVCDVGGIGASGKVEDGARGLIVIDGFGEARCVVEREENGSESGEVHLLVSGVSLMTNCVD